MRLIWLTLLLAGCASQPVYLQSYYPDYRASLVDAVLKADNHEAPPEVVNAYAECSADFLVSRMSPADKARMDAWVSQRAELTRGEGQAIEDRLSAATGGPITYETMDRLSGTCPDKVPLFKQYFKPA